MKTSAARLGSLRRMAASGVDRGARLRRVLQCKVISELSRASSIQSEGGEAFEQERLVPGLDAQLASLFELRTGGGPHHDDAGVL